MGDCDHDIVTDYLGHRHMNEEEYEAFVKSHDQEYVEKFGNSIWLLVVGHGIEEIQQKLIQHITYTTRIMSMAKYAHSHFPDIGGRSINPIYITAIFDWIRCFKLSSILDCLPVIEKLQQTIRSLAEQYNVDLSPGTGYHDIGILGSPLNDSLFDLNEKIEEEKQDQFGIYFLNSSSERDKHICVSEEHYTDYNILTSKIIQDHLLKYIVDEHYKFLLTNLIRTKTITLSSLIMLLFSLGYQHFNIISITCRERSRQHEKLDIKKQFKILARSAVSQSASVENLSQGERLLRDKSILRNLKKSQSTQHDKALIPLINSYENSVLKQFIEGSVGKAESQHAVSNRIKEWKAEDIQRKDRLPQKEIGAKSKSKSKSKSRSSRSRSQSRSRSRGGKLVKKKYKRKTKLNIFNK